MCCNVEHGLKVDKKCTIIYLISRLDLVCQYSYGTSISECDKVHVVKEASEKRDFAVWTSARRRQSNQPRISSKLLTTTLHCNVYKY
jgi:hypothetical protein